MWVVKLKPSKKAPLTEATRSSEGKPGVASVEAWHYPNQKRPQASRRMKVGMVVIQIDIPLGRRGALTCLEI